MKSRTKYALVYLTVISVTVMLAVNLAQAQEPTEVVSVDAYSDADLNETEQEGVYVLDQGELDQMLAPIALYPDTVLSHILVASTYPLEVIQAARWREKNASLSEEEVMEAIVEQDWDPSIKALVPFNELLQQITEDLNWLQDLGDAFLINEEQVLTNVQGLRQKAYAQGSLENSEYIEVVEEDNDIVIQPAKTEIVYVPYYDTRTVYGTWGWQNYPPIFWQRPAHYYWHAGLYWSPRVYVRHNIFWGGFNWRNRYIVVNNNRPNNRYLRDDGVRRVSSSEYQRWQHNPSHRRGVRYNSHTPKVVYRQQDRNSSKMRVRSSEGKSQIVNKSRPVQLRQKTNDVRLNSKSQQTQQRLQRQTDTRTGKENVRQVSSESRNNVVQRSQSNTSNQSANKAQRQQSNATNNSASKQRYTNKQSQGAQRSVKSYSTNRSQVSRPTNRTQPKQSSRGSSKER